jgi:hypothetical protein
VLLPLKGDELDTLLPHGLDKASRGGALERPSKKTDSNHCSCTETRQKSRQGVHKMLI